MPLDEKTRRYPMNKPPGFTPTVQRYRATPPAQATRVGVVVAGLQSRVDDDAAGLRFLADARAAFDAPDGPVHADFATFTDRRGHRGWLSMAYWWEADARERWTESGPGAAWWRAAGAAALSQGHGAFRESFACAVDRLETIAFREYVRGLSACPHAALQAMGESGYWGAARDRIRASAHDRMDAAGPPLAPDPRRHGRAKRVAIVPPANLCVIRSGVSWEACGEEQLSSYRRNIEPKLDAGMEHLRAHPADTGCASLRQLDVIGLDGQPAKEAYSLGYFRSLGDLEHWARHHPTHLAIFTRAMAEREKYGDRLELRTYHEVYVLEAGAGRFDYVNCHPWTGLLPYVDAAA